MDLVESYAERFEPVETGTPVAVVLDVDGADFAERWLHAIERADRPATP